MCNDIGESGFDKYRLGNQCEIITKGTTPNHRGFEYKRSGVTFVKIESISANGSLIPDKFAYIDNACHSALKRSQLQTNDLLYSIAGALGRRAVVEPSLLPANTNQAVAIVRLGDESRVDLRYLFHYLIGPQIRSHINRINVQSAQANLSLENVNDFVIEAPASKEEQSKIAEILSTVDRAIEQTEALIAKQQRIKTGLMQDLLTRGIDEQGNLRSEQTHKFKDSPLGRIPEEWEARRIADLVTAGVIAGVQDGNHGEKHPKSRDFVDEGIPFIMASDISNGIVDCENASKITEAQYEGLRIGFAKPEDVLLSHKASIGFVALVPDDIKRLMLTPQVTYYRIEDKDRLMPEFLAQFFRSERWQLPLKVLAGQSTRDYVGILAQQTLHVCFPKCKAEQEQIVKTLRSHDENSTQVNDSLQKLHSLKTALMQDLLTGEKRVTPLLDADVTEDAVHA